MRVHEAGDDAAAGQVDLLSLGTGEPADFGVGSDRQELAVAHGHRLRDGEAGVVLIRRQDLPAIQDHFRIGNEKVRHAALLLRVDSPGVQQQAENGDPGDSDRPADRFFSENPCHRCLLGHPVT